jgi:hypothetical protein
LATSSSEVLDIPRGRSLVNASLEGANREKKCVIRRGYLASGEALMRRGSVQYSRLLCGAAKKVFIHTITNCNLRPVASTVGDVCGG